MISEQERQRLLTQSRFEHEGNNICRKIEGEQPQVMGEAYTLVSEDLGVVVIGWTNGPIGVMSESGAIEWIVHPQSKG